MHRFTTLSILVVFLISLASALETSKHIQISAWPLSESTGHTLAEVDYNSTQAIVKKSWTPKVGQKDDIVRVGFYHPVSNAWSGVATSASNFEEGKDKTLLLHLDTDGNLFHVGFRALESLNGQRRNGETKAEIVASSPPPLVHLNKPVVLNAEGQLEKPPEKTFLQKYWWAIGGFLLLQLVLSGGGDKKE